MLVGYANGVLYDYQEFLVRDGLGRCCVDCPPFGVLDFDVMEVVVDGLWHGVGLCWGQGVKFFCVWLAGWGQEVPVQGVVSRDVA